nr:hypothetical protein CFP56_30918 [Quercus suber]
MADGSEDARNCTIDTVHARYDAGKDDWKDWSSVSELGRRGKERDVQMSNQVRSGRMEGLRRNFEGIGETILSRYAANEQGSHARDGHSAEW